MEIGCLICALNVPGGLQLNWLSTKSFATLKRIHSLSFAYDTAPPPEMSGWPTPRKEDKRSYTKPNSCSTDRITVASCWNPLYSFRSFIGDDGL